MTISRRKTAMLKKLYTKLAQDESQPVDVRLKAASRLQKLYEQEAVPAPAPVTKQQALDAIAAVTGKEKA